MKEGSELAFRSLPRIFASSPNLSAYEYRIENYRFDGKFQIFLSTEIKNHILQTDSFIHYYKDSHTEWKNSSIETKKSVASRPYRRTLGASMKKQSTSIYGNQNKQSKNPKRKSEVSSNILQPFLSFQLQSDIHSKRHPPAVA